jgi:hypothetical protein
MSCCDYGKCINGANCPVRSRSEYDANKLMLENPVQYMPKVEYEPYSYFADFIHYVRSTLLPWTLGLALGALVATCYLLG